MIYVAFPLYLGLCTLIPNSMTIGKRCDRFKQKFAHRFFGAKSRASSFEGKLPLNISKCLFYLIFHEQYIFSSLLFCKTKSQFSHTPRINKMAANQWSDAACTGCTHRYRETFLIAPAVSILPEHLSHGSLPSVENLVTWTQESWFTTKQPLFVCLGKKQPVNLEERKFGWLGSGNPKKRSFEKWEHLVLTTSLSRSLYAHPSLPSLCSSTHSLFWLWASLTLVQQSLGVVVARCLCCVRR